MLGPEDAQLGYLKDAVATLAFAVLLALTLCCDAHRNKTLVALLLFNAMLIDAVFTWNKKLHCMTVSQLLGKGNKPPPITLCFAVRLALVLAASQLSPRWRRPAAVVAAAVSASFFYQYQRRLVAFESTADGKRVWWDDVRPVHGLLWALYAALAWHRKRGAWAVLAADLLFGRAVWLARR